MGTGFASKRFEGYMKIHRDLEMREREMFIAKGGSPQRDVPHYMTLSKCDWLLSWHKEPMSITISLKDINHELVSLTYGDLFPTMRCNDGRDYKKKVYTLAEIKSVVEQFPFPQEWNNEGKFVPERYVEAQVWCDIYDITILN